MTEPEVSELHKITELDPDTPIFNACLGDWNLWLASEAAASANAVLPSEPAPQPAHAVVTHPA